MKKKLFFFALVLVLGWQPLSTHDEFCGIRNLAFEEGENISFNVLPAANGMSSSLFLVSSGYYHNLQKLEGKPDKRSLLHIGEKSGFDRFSRNKYAIVQGLLARKVIEESAAMNLGYYKQ